MKVNSKQEAWERADEMFPTDYIKDDVASTAAGYDIYTSTAEGVNAWISDLEDRLEINLETGKTINIGIEEQPWFPEYHFADALQVISEAIYQIDDSILPNFQKVTGISEARAKLYETYAEIAKLLRSQHPNSFLYDKYNLSEA